MKGGVKMYISKNCVISCGLVGTLKFAKQEYVSFPHVNLESLGPRFHKRFLPTDPHRKSKAGKHVWRVSSPTPCLELGQLQQFAQVRVPLNVEYLQWWRCHNLDGQSVPVFDHVQI